MNLCGTVMSADIVVARVENGNIISVIENLMPLYLKRTSDMEGWLASRAIDKHRTNSRLLKKALRLTAAEDVEVALRVHGATITDNYWFKEDGSSLSYDDIKFKENMFDKLALYGDPDSFNCDSQTTPELTNIGSYEKCWRLENGKWWLYKQGNENELFSELFIYHLGKQMNFNMAYYEKADKYIKSLDFTNNAWVNFESMFTLLGDEEDYLLNFETLDGICPDAACDYVKMIYLDTICFNMDRHTKNYGVLRDIKSGEVIGLAPNFDNNIALISRGYPKNTDRINDKLISLFAEFIFTNNKAKAVYENISSPTKEMVKKAIKKTGFKVDEECITKFITNGVKRIKNG